MPNFDNYSPQDFLDKLKKMPVGELNLTSQREHITAYFMTMEKQNKYNYI